MSLLEPKPPASCAAMRMHGQILAAAFFDRPAVVVARELLGKKLVRRLPTGFMSSTIIETEAYAGPHDLACHAARGRTRRTEVMFGPPGRLYVYLVYGLYWMLNVVTERTGYPAAVLIRGVEAVSGPGRLAMAFQIDGALHGRRASKATGLWFESADAGNPDHTVARTARIGVDYAGPVWAVKKLRFVVTPKRSR